MAAPRTKKPKPKRKYKLSEEGRKRLSEAAKARGLGGSEAGKLGGRGNTKEKRLAGQAVAEAAAEDAQQIVQVFRDAIDPERPLQQRLRGAELYVKVAQDNAKLDHQKQKAESERMSRAELIDLIAGRLSTGPTAQILSAHMQNPRDDDNVIDGTYTELTDGNG